MSKRQNHTCKKNTRQHDATLNYSTSMTKIFIKIIERFLIKLPFEWLDYKTPACLYNHTWMSDLNLFIGTYLLYLFT